MKKSLEILTPDQKKNDERIDMVLEQISNLIKGDYKARISLNGEKDKIASICAALNNLATDLDNQRTDKSDDKNRLDSITDVLLEYTVSNFSRKAVISDKGDEIDSVSAGLNVLGEELEFAISSQKKYSDDLERINTLLSQSNEKIRTIFDNAPDAIIATNLDHKITEWNKAAEAMYKYTREEIIGRSIDDIIQSEHILPLTRKKAEEEMKKTGLWKEELYQASPRKEKMTVLSSTSLLKDGNGIALGYLEVNRDITEIRKTEKQLGEIDKLYHLLVNEVADYAIILLDTKGNIVSWNKGAEKIKGYTEDEIIGKHFSVFYTDEEKEKGIPLAAMEATKREKKYVCEGWRVRKDKSLFWADVVITELVDAEGNLKGFVKITRDLTERKKAENEILKRTEELKRSNAELEQFAYVASHDLQEPLRMITSYVQLIEKHYKDKLDKDANDFIHFAVDGANRMQTLIYSLLDYSRINRIKPFESIDLDDVLQEVMKDLSVSIKESKAKIIWDKLPEIYGDKVLIGQLFFNLIANAIKFKGDRTPEINISYKKLNGNYVFAVKDNGIGIKKEYCEKIFVIFQRLHSKDKYPGTGIGLAICKKIVERHEGKIWVESELNKGSTFYFTIKTDLRQK
jgi:PAS domain S-box-containing protein